MLIVPMRRLATPVAAVAAVVLFLLYNPWFDVPTSTQPILTVLFWLAAIATGVLLFADRKNPDAEVVEVEGPAFSRFLFNNTQAGLLWLAIRIFVGFQWLEAGWGKLSGHGWIDGGASLLSYWKSAVAIPQTGQYTVSSSSILALLSSFLVVSSPDSNCSQRLANIFRLPGANNP